jgi:starvation-inducible DNA-binding protein
MRRTAKVNTRIKINESQRNAIAYGLNLLLTDLCNSYFKTKNYHWNAKGTIYQTFHKMFESQHTDLASAFDSIAGRIRALGFPAPVSEVQFNDPKSLKETPGEIKSQEMVKDILEDQETIIRRALSIFPVVEKAGDEVTKELIIQRIQVHEEMSSTLRSFLINQ